MPSSGMEQPSIEIVNSRYNETCQPMLGQYVYFTTTLPRDSSKQFTIIALHAGAGAWKMEKFLTLILT